jgi:hypothetical protein
MAKTEIPDWNDEQGMGLFLDRELDRQLNAAMKAKEENMDEKIALMRSMAKSRPRGRPRRSVGRPRTSTLQRMSTSFLWAAAQDVERIRAIWATHYDRRHWVKKRAVRFAAERWKVDPSQLASYVSRSKSARQRIEVRRKPTRD